MWLGLVQSVEGLKRTKRVICVSLRGVPPACKRGFPDGCFQIVTLVFLIPLNSNWDCTISSCGSSACQFTLMILVFVSFHSHMSQFPQVHISQGSQWFPGEL
jgi:hypothetical protein